MRAGVAVRSAQPERGVAAARPCEDGRGNWQSQGGREHRGHRRSVKRAPWIHGGADAIERRAASRGSRAEAGRDAGCSAGAPARLQEARLRIAVRSLRAGRRLARRHAQHAAAAGGRIDLEGRRWRKRVSATPRRQGAAALPRHGSCEDGLGDWQSQGEAERIEAASAARSAHDADAVRARHLGSTWSRKRQPLSRVRATGSPGSRRKTVRD